MKELLSRSISKKQILILNEVDNNRGMVVTNLINKLSKENNLPESTLRWNINQLKKQDLIISGDCNSKGTPISLTKTGLILLKIIRGDKNE